MGCKFGAYRRKDHFMWPTFSPLSLLATAIFSTLVWAEQLYCGRLVNFGSSRNIKQRENYSCILIF